MESLNQLFGGGHLLLRNHLSLVTKRLTRDDQVHRAASINPTALHVTECYREFSTHHKPKVLILFCGGTLIMREQEDGSLVVNDKDIAIQQLLQMEPQIQDKLAELDVHFIDNIDSSNMSPETWDVIGQVIHDKYLDYDGFVVTHGTDTMAYTASALSFVLGDLGKPVIITGAQIPGSRIETDARRNFVNAVRVATLDRAGVMLVFDGDIILGARSHKLSESKLDAFGPINWGLHGEVRIDIRFSDSAKPRHDRPLQFQPGFEPNIGVYTLFPGFPPSELIANIERGSIKGLVLNAYGSGNISYVYLDAIKLATSKGIAVVVTTQCLEGATLMHLYDVGRQALNSGVIQAYDMSKECIITKLMWALKRTSDLKEVQNIMHTNYTGEINIEGKLYGAKT